MLNEVRPALVILLFLTLLTGLAYPLGITALAGLIFPRQAQGSIVEPGAHTATGVLVPPGVTVPSPSWP